MSDPRTWPPVARETLARILSKAKAAHTCTDCGKVGPMTLTPVAVDGAERLVPTCEGGCR